MASTIRSEGSFLHLTPWLGAWGMAALSILLLPRTPYAPDVARWVWLLTSGSGVGLVIWNFVSADRNRGRRQPSLLAARPLVEGPICWILLNNMAILLVIRNRPDDPDPIRVLSALSLISLLGVFGSTWQVVWHVIDNGPTRRDIFVGGGGVLLLLAGFLADVKMLTTFIASV